MKVFKLLPYRARSSWDLASDLGLDPKHEPTTPEHRTDPRFDPGPNPDD